MTNSNDPFKQFKAAARESWAHFAPLEAVTMIPAGKLVAFVGVNPKERVLDVATGTGVVAVSAARRGAAVKGLDLSPVLVEKAKANAKLAEVEIDFVEGDAEALPYDDASFDVVLSQYGHMFAPRPEVAISEMLRVLKPGGRIGFSTWPPEHFVGKMFSLVGKYLPPPAGVAPNPQWGDPKIVLERLGNSVKDVIFERDVMSFPALSPGHYRKIIENGPGPVVKLVEVFKDEPKRIEQFFAELNVLLAQHTVGNELRQHFLMTKAVKS